MTGIPGPKGSAPPCATGGFETALRLGLSALLCASLLPGAGFDITAWKYRAAVQVAEKGRLVVIPFDRTLYARMRRDLADLRIVKGSEEVPYIIETVTGSIEERACHPGMLDKSVVPGIGVRTTLDLTPCNGAPRHSRIRLATNETNFRQQVRIEISEDNHFWSVAREDGYIFDFTQGDRKLSVLTVDYPVATRRYLRVTVLGWTKSAAVADAWSIYRVERPAEQYILDAVTPSRTEDSKSRSTILALDLGQAGLPHNRVRLESNGESFHRGVEIEASDDNQTWRIVAQGTIFQVPGERSLAISYPERHDRYLRMRIYNGDNRPVPAPRVYVETLKRLIKFLPPSDGDYRMYYGNAAVKPAVYDLGAILSRQAPAPETTPAVSEWQTNPDYRPPAESPKPWSERHPAVLYGVLGVAIVGMGVVTVRFLMKVRSA